MARPSVSVRAQVLTALQTYTQSQLAERLGVSTRTIRRWKNEGVEPANDFVRLALRDEYRDQRDKIRRYTRQHAPQAHIPESPIPLLGERRWLRKYGADNKWTGEYIPSDYVNYNVVGLDVDSLFDVLKDLRDSGSTIQLIYRVRQYPGERQFILAGARNATSLFNLRGFTDSDLWGGFGAYKGLASYVTRGNNTRILLLAVLDRGAPPKTRKPRARKKK